MTARKPVAVSRAPSGPVAAPAAGHRSGMRWPRDLPDDYIYLPDPPQKEDMTSPIHLLHPGKSKALEAWLGNRDTTLFLFDFYIVPVPISRVARSTIYPDMLIAFDVDPQLAIDRNGYVISEMGKPPDLVMEIASRSTAHIDDDRKRSHYASLGIPEYWRFDQTGGKLHQAALAGDRLVGNRYEAIAIEETAPGCFRGYSDVLKLYVCYDNSELQWYDPVQEAYLLDHEGEIARANAEAARANAEAARADSEGARADAEGARARAAEAEIRRLRELLDRGRRE